MSSKSLPIMMVPLPTPARLIVRTDQGDEWEATVEDLERIDFGKRSDIYARAERLLCEAMGVKDPEDFSEAAQAVRYMIECAVCYKHSPWADENGEPWTSGDTGDQVKMEIREALRLIDDDARN